jgi:hypothetical protein
VISLEVHLARIFYACYMSCPSNPSFHFSQYQAKSMNCFITKFYESSLDSQLPPPTPHQKSKLSHTNAINVCKNNIHKGLWLHIFCSMSHSCLSSPPGPDWLGDTRNPVCYSYYYYCYYHKHFTICFDKNSSKQGAILD